MLVNVKNTHHHLCSEGDSRLHSCHPPMIHTITAITGLDRTHTCMIATTTVIVLPLALCMCAMSQAEISHTTHRSVVPCLNRLTAAACYFMHATSCCSSAVQISMYCLYLSIAVQQLQYRAFALVISPKRPKRNK